MIKNKLNKPVPKRNSKPFVSILIPCRNEEKYIGSSLDSVIANTYPKEKIEIFVIDGRSEDRTRDIILDYSKKYPFIKLLDNGKKIVPTALNQGIQKAQGDIVIRLDAHNTYDSNYISKCVEYLQKYDVDNVGGIWITRQSSSTMIAKAISLAISHPFGVGNSTYRLNSRKPQFVDTVPFGCYRKEVFERIGVFNNSLVRNQDLEFNLRLKRAGGKILLVPDIVSYYHARSSLKALFKQNFMNGLWVIYSLKFAKLPFSIRHFVPFIFVICLVCCFILSLFYQFYLYVFVLILSTYLIVNIICSLQLSVKNKFKYLPAIISSFLVLHFSYGLGSMWGIAKWATSRLLEHFNT